MIVNSFMHRGYATETIEVEVQICKGPSDILILGLPDQTIKESSQRVKSALAAQGYRIPPGSRVLVNLRPTYVRKNSRGLDLAIALPILAITNQVKGLKDQIQGAYIYGELQLNGKTKAPDDLKYFCEEFKNHRLITGELESDLPVACASISSLKDAHEMSWLEPKQKVASFERPKLSSTSFNKSQAELLSVVALGEHPFLLAGPAGSGKTTFVNQLLSLLAEPNEREFLQARKLTKYFSGEDLKWRPLIMPHHSATAISLVGGGSPPKPGEISRAHSGVLVMDELLEFHPKVQAGLREPIETGKVRVARGNHIVEYPASFMLAATTNLCPCGKFSPDVLGQCRCSSLKLRNYMERLTGPFLDRFQLLGFSSQWVKLRHKEEQVTCEEIFLQLEKARGFIKERGQRGVNSKLDEGTLINQLESEVSKQVLPIGVSGRRYLSILRLARSYADLEGSSKIKLSHVRSALSVAYLSFFELHQVLL